MKIEKTTIDNIKNYRKDYLNSLPVFQELFIELMLSNSDCYSFHKDGETTGYAIQNSDGVLIEFYVISNHQVRCRDIFNQVLRELSVSEIYCKSFDFLLLDNCLLNNMAYSVIGVLYRDYVEPSVKLNPEITMERADHSSVGLLQSQDGSIRELFETERQLTEFINKENVFEFYVNNELVGCGMVLRTNPDWNYCDLGIWVKPSMRGKGVGSQIMLNLRKFAICNDMLPCCGCAVENIASQKTIEKSGFVSKYKLIKFKSI